MLKLVKSQNIALNYTLSGFQGPIFNGKGEDRKDGREEREGKEGSKWKGSEGELGAYF